MTCGRCGDDLPPTCQVDGQDAWGDGDAVVCPSCGARNQMSSDGEDAWVGCWWCKHDVAEDVACAACDAEEAANAAC